ncbi:unnamed protein product (macronuclear) [Paramecium tetraurelia]|uniref:Uncharacterized protein n=1 Tax=Paramecium tetraurelia TaxID=5888 RepID=A0E4P0_PARTE|nr:uncharacterized protein GSPATT00023432001 [Paramecium tetraurelia]CAK90257.1 unnamed protein product [Paramecium tetraurelia]|eukprot:XP_001457654.1 hypothetical protein (macronuclear) [Paramecium tetraurelia strain d4-2]
MHSKHLLIQASIIYYQIYLKRVQSKQQKQIYISDQSIQQYNQIGNTSDLIEKSYKIIQAIDLFVLIRILKLNQKLKPIANQKVEVSLYQRMSQTKIPSKSSLKYPQECIDASVKKTQTLSCYTFFESQQIKINQQQILSQDIIDLIIYFEQRRQCLEVEMLPTSSFLKNCQFMHYRIMLNNQRTIIRIYSILGKNLLFQQKVHPLISFIKYCTQQFQQIQKWYKQFSIKQQNSSIYGRLGLLQILNDRMDIGYYCSLLEVRFDLQFQKIVLLFQNEESIQI